MAKQLYCTLNILILSMLYIGTIMKFMIQAKIWLSRDYRKKKEDSEG